MGEEDFVRLLRTTDHRDPVWPDQGPTLVWIEETFGVGPERARVLLEQEGWEPGFNQGYVKRS